MIARVFAMLTLSEASCCATLSFSERRCAIFFSKPRDRAAASSSFITTHYSGANSIFWYLL